METTKCRCTNFSQCSKADNKEIIDVPVGRELKCPECGLDLDEIKDNHRHPPWRRLLMIGVPIVIIVIAGIFLFGRGKSPIEPTPPLLTGISINGPSKVEENKTAKYSTTASYKEGEAKEVEANCSLSPDTYASISTKGLLTTKTVPSDQNVTISAEYSEGRVTQKATTSVVIKKLIPEKPAQEPQKASVDEIKKLSAELNFQQGMNYVQSEDYGNAIKEFTAAIDKFPDYSSAYANRAVAYMQQKKFNLAADDLKKASELTPKDPNVYYNFTALYSLQKQLDLALGALDKALEYGFNNYDSLRKDPDLKNLRNHPEYRQVLEKHKIFLK